MSSQKTRSTWPSVTGVTSASRVLMLSRATSNASALDTSRQSRGGASHLSWKALHVICLLHVVGWRSFHRPHCFFPRCLPPLAASLHSMPPSTRCLPPLAASLHSLPPSPLCLPPCPAIALATGDWCFTCPSGSFPHDKKVCSIIRCYPWADVGPRSLNPPTHQCNSSHQNYHGSRLSRRICQLRKCSCHWHKQIGLVGK